MNEREKGDNDHRDFSYLHLIETAAAFAVSVNYKWDNIVGAHIWNDQSFLTLFLDYFKYLSKV